MIYFLVIASLARLSRGITTGCGSSSDSFCTLLTTSISTFGSGLVTRATVVVGAEIVVASNGGIFFTASQRPIKPATTL